MALKSIEAGNAVELRVTGSTRPTQLPGDAHDLQKNGASSNWQHQIPAHVHDRNHSEGERPDLKTLKRDCRDRICAVLVEKDQFLRPSPERAVHAHANHSYIERQEGQCAHNLAACQCHWKEREPGGEVHLKRETNGGVSG